MTGNNPLLPVAVIGAVIFGATFWFAPAPDDPPVAAPPPPGLPTDRNHVLTLRGDQYGQFWTKGIVAGRFLCDTGASDISFGRDAARKLGLDPARLVYTGLTSTANGIIRTASARVAWLQVGPFLLRDVPVTIGDADMDEPVLGMSFLRRFKLTIHGDALTISE
jgi:clan AA aspartic protease (TIGR02281 family)